MQLWQRMQGLKGEGRPPLAFISARAAAAAPRPLHEARPLESSWAVEPDQGEAFESRLLEFDELDQSPDLARAEHGADPPRRFLAREGRDGPGAVDRHQRSQRGG